MHAVTRFNLLSKNAIRSCWYVVGITGLLILYIGQWTNLDVWLATFMYDRTSHSFPWRDAWLTSRFGHEYVKRVLTLLALIPIGLAVGEMFLRRRYLSDWWRLRIRVVALCAILVPTVISLLKQASTSHCPWDLTSFGGTQPYFRLLDHVPSWVEAGKCLPGGHASSALWLVGIAVFWLPHSPRRAFFAGAAAMLLGAALGWIQQMRGAHFLTHTLWSMWIAGSFIVTLLSMREGIPGIGGEEAVTAPGTAGGEGAA